MTYKVLGYDNDLTVISETEYDDDWTAAQDKAVELLDGDADWVQIREWDEFGKMWCALQELNLKVGVMPDPNFSSNSFAPYYVRLRKLNYER